MVWSHNFSVSILTCTAYAQQRYFDCQKICFVLVIVISYVLVHIVQVFAFQIVCHYKIENCFWTENRVLPLYQALFEIEKVVGIVAFDVERGKDFFHVHAANAVVQLLFDGFFVRIVQMVEVNWEILFQSFQKVIVEEAACFLCEIVYERVHVEYRWNTDEAVDIIWTRILRGNKIQCTLCTRSKCA